jgi:hypothetical protein
MTDFRARCAELVELDQAAPGDYANWRQNWNAAIARARAALEAQPEPQGPPKNCWLDDEPYLCPSPCVFDDPSEVIDNCVEARYLSEKNKPKEACKYYRTTAQPEPQGPTDEELWELYDEIGGAPEDSAWCANYARAVLARWGRPAIEPVPGVEGGELDGKNG